jgi:hypothetical protein
VTVHQEAVAPTACVYSVSPMRASLPVGGGTVTFTVTVTQGTNCAWTAQTIGNGLNIVAGGQGVGSGTVVVVVDANPGTQRWQGLLLAGENPTIYQPEAPGGCVYRVSPESFSISAAGQTVTFDVTLTTGSLQHCQFSVSHERGMLTTLTLTPDGNTTRVVVAVSENTGTTPRTGIIWIAGLQNPMQIPVNQAGRPPAP